MSEKIAIDNAEMEELLRMQNEFLVGGQKPAASCIRPQKKVKSSNIKDKKSVQFSGVFVAEESKAGTEESAKVEASSLENFAVEPIIGGICERFAGFFETPERVQPPIFNNNDKADDAVGLLDDAEDLPDIPDLSAHWSTTTKASTSSEDKSIFATYFDTKQAEITEPTKKVSHFKAARLADSAPNALPASGAFSNNGELRAAEQLDNDEAENRNQLEDETIRNLEVFRAFGLDADPTADEYSRLAMNAIDSNLASKVLKATAPRQEANILRLFDALKTNEPAESVRHKNGRLCQQARAQIEEIKALYLEEYQIEAGLRVWRFAADVNPATNGAWSLVPIRRVLDAMHRRDAAASDVTADDVDICRLALLWSVLLLVERPSLFHLLSMPNEVYVRLAELFLVGPAAFNDPTVDQCVSLLLNDYLLKKGEQNLLSLPTAAPIAELDAFMPFFEDLLKHFEEFSMGNENFALIVLVAGYMNSAVGDALLPAQAIWSPCRHVVRQITAPASKAAQILSTLRKRRDTPAFIVHVEEHQHEAYARLLAMYTAAIRDESVTHGRNPAMFELAAGELSAFVRRHAHETGEVPSHFSDERIKEFEVLVEAIRVSIADKISH